MNERVQRAASVEIAADFVDAGVKMNMAVTDEEERLFNAGELSEDDHDMGVEANASDDSEGETEMDKNNNAMAAHKTTDVTVNKGVDLEEIKFMERFAVFMEKRGFIQKGTENHNL